MLLPEFAMTDTNDIILIDAYAQIYRGFFAVRYLSTSSGQPSNAVFALAKFLLKVHEECPSDSGAFVFDLGRPQFRLELAPDYKANRPPMPDEMKSQLPYVRRLIEAFGWPVMEAEGYEADDLIAAIVKEFPGRNIKIVSHDKDIAQLIDDRVQMLIPDRKDGGMKIQDTGEVEAKFGVRPDQVVDYLSLIGDNSDNIPGIQGVGPKTATKLINEFGDIDNLIASADKISNAKLKEKIVNGVDILRKNRELITLNSNVEGMPVSGIDSLNRRQPDWKALREIATELELKSIVKEIDKLDTGTDLFSTPAPEPEKSPEPKPEQPKDGDDKIQPNLL